MTFICRIWSSMRRLLPGWKDTSEAKTDESFTVEPNACFGNERIT